MPVIPCDFEILCPEGGSAAPVRTVLDGCAALYTFRFEWSPECAQNNGEFRVSWSFPALDMPYLWSPLCGHDRSVKPNWKPAPEDCMISRNAPVQALFDGQGIASYVWQLSECRMLSFLHTGIVEETGCVECYFRLGTRQFTELFHCEITLRTDRSRVPLYEALQKAALWWEKDLGMTAAFIPEEAYDACYSFWYSFHQNVREEEVEEECRRAKALGFDACIVDDGWQTDDSSRGYAFCGDWVPAPSKIRDMAAHVKRVHGIGMKYILWYSVPLIGFRSAHYETFRGMLLRDVPRNQCAVLDPRYRAVRDFLCGVYEKALRDWDLDGFKLDFIDQWCFDMDNAPYAKGMDIASLEEAASVFLEETCARLKRIKPDLLLEFRQGYIGPHMREYGNMFRVGDCPDDLLANRCGVLDLRMTMGRSAVHSDMLMWHREEKPENAALQMISVLFGVIQYSARLSGLSEELQAMSRFWLGFAKAHKETLLKSELKTYEPQLLYSWAQAVSAQEVIAAVYSVDKCIRPELREVIFIANGAPGERILADIRGDFFVSVLDCRGLLLSAGKYSLSGLSEFSVPVGGLLKLEKIEVKG